MKRSDSSGRADRISREIRLRESIPLLRDLIPLLFGCYSAVNSAVIPLLFRCRRRQFIPQIPETANVFETIFAKDGCIGFFLPINSGIWISCRPGICPRRAAESRLSGGMLEKHA
jgi:hypothetical protein